MIEIAQRAYAALPLYNTIPTQKLIPKGRSEILTAAQSESSSGSSSFRKANELLFLGLYDEGAPALAAAQNLSDESATNTDVKPNASKTSENTTNKSTPVTPSTISRDEAFTIAVLFKRGELAEHAIRYAEPMWKTVPRDFLIELAPREMVELLYPAPYAKSLDEYAVSRGVDPRFLLSIMRQESRFRADAKSTSAARGLMQFIPATADKIATQLGKNNFQNDDLYSPRVAILFGSQYLGNLFKFFPNMPHAVAASYNGGEEAVERWVARARSNDPDRYVPEIGFAQSKDYVYKVMSNYRVYQKLYDEELRAR
jgi:soluble lytic murein transglycosylase